MKSFKISFFLSILSMFLFPALTFAGGGPLGVEAWPLQPYSQTQAYIVAARLYVPQCDNIDVKATIFDQKDGDTITSYTPPDDGTYYQPHYYTEKNTWEKICMKYFIVKSATRQLRTVEVQATVDGTLEKADYQVAFGDDENSKELQKYGRVNDYENSPIVDVIAQKQLNQYKQQFDIQWQKISWAKRYSVFAKELETDGTTTANIQLETTENTHVSVVLQTDHDYYLSVLACKEDDSCNTPSENMYEVLVSRPASTTTVSSSSQTITPIPSVVSKSDTNQDKIDALNKKVAALEGKLDASNKKQNMLEEKLSQLLDFIRSLFPSFK